MKKENIKVIVAIVIVGVLTLGITETFAYFTYSDKQTTANTFKSGCLEISIENVTNALDLNNQKPITDVEGLKSEGYEFKIKNTCTTKERYEINLETLTGSTLNAEYVRVSLSSDTFDNIITTLSENETRAYHSSDTSTSYNLYTGEINGNSEKTFKLREWVKYETTVEEGSNKIYKSKINVIANPDLELESNFKEIKHENEEGTITVNNITGSTYKYCTTSDAECEPSTTQSITDNKVTYTLENKSNDQIICSSIDNSKTICSDVIIKKEPKTMQQIIADNYKTVRERANGTFGSVVSGSTTGVIYKSTSDENQKDNDGNDVYYFAGAPTDNWVKFGRTGTSGPSSGEPIWWRIIRINGDGSVRMIYAGTGSSAPNTTGTGTQLSSGTTGFAPTGTTSTCAGGKASTYCYNDNKFVGYMFNKDKGTASTSYSDAHDILTTTSNRKNSNIKDVIDSWYKENLLDESTYLSDDTGFCGDRSSSTSSSGTPAKDGGYGTQVTYYGGYVRLYNKNDPTFKCKYKDNDLYTVVGNQKNKGNKALQYPIGLITADEVAFAGGVNGKNNTSYYLYNGKYYWTMSPYYFYDGYAIVFYVNSGGGLDSDYVGDTRGVRPVINLSADVTFAEGGAGTTGNPYVPT